MNFGKERLSRTQHRINIKVQYCWDSVIDAPGPNMDELWDAADTDPIGEPQAINYWRKGVWWR